MWGLMHAKQLSYHQTVCPAQIVIFWAWCKEGAIDELENNEIEGSFSFQWI